MTTTSWLCEVADATAHHQVCLEFLHQQPDAQPCSTVAKNGPPKADRETD